MIPFPVNFTLTDSISLMFSIKKPGFEISKSRNSYFFFDLEKFLESFESFLIEKHPKLNWFLILWIAF